MESKKQKFLKYPNINPSSNKEIEIGGKEYKKLVEKYGEPLKINNPITQHKISVNKGEYKKLLKRGYTHEQLLYPIKNVKKEKKEKKDEKKEKDILYEILLNADVEMVEILINENPSYNNESFWIDKFTHDELPLVKNLNLSSYKDVIFAIDEAKKILTINKIEHLRTSYKTDGIIVLKYDINNVNFKGGVVLTLSSKNKFKYNILYKHDDVKKSLPEKEVISMLTLFLYDLYNDYEDNIVMSPDGVNFRLTDINLDSPMALLRFGIYETLKLQDYIVK
jgi:hypothetical protein